MDLFRFWCELFKGIVLYTVELCWNIFIGCSLLALDCLGGVFSLPSESRAQQFLDFAAKFIGLKRIYNGGTPDIPVVLLFLSDSFCVKIVSIDCTPKYKVEFLFDIPVPSNKYFLLVLSI